MTLTAHIVATQPALQIDDAVEQAPVLEAQVLLTQPRLEISADNKAQSSSDKVVEADTPLSFPAVGETNTIYIAKSENASYRWNDADLHYYCIGRDYNEIELIDGTI